MNRGPWDQAAFCLGNLDERSLMLPKFANFAKTLSYKTVSLLGRKIQ
jgi:hypothetical protein